jgi:hypothetical protein
LRDELGNQLYGVLNEEVSPKAYFGYHYKYRPRNIVKGDIMLDFIGDNIYNLLFQYCMYSAYSSLASKEQEKELKMNQYKVEYEKELYTVLSQSKTLHGESKTSSFGRVGV